MWRVKKSKLTIKLVLHILFKEILGDNIELRYYSEINYMLTETHGIARLYIIGFGYLLTHAALN